MTDVFTKSSTDPTRTPALTCPPEQMPLPGSRLATNRQDSCKPKASDVCGRLGKGLYKEGMRTKLELIALGEKRGYPGQTGRQ